METDRGWLTIHWHKLEFTPHCFRCGVETSETHAVSIKLRRGILDVFLRIRSYLDLSVPMCLPCSKALENRDVFGGLGAALAGLVGSVALCLIVAVVAGFDVEFSIVLGGILGIVLAGVLFFYAPGWVGWLAPFMFRSKDPASETRAVSAGRLVWRVSSMN